MLIAATSSRIAKLPGFQTKAAIVQGSHVKESSAVSNTWKMTTHVAEPASIDSSEELVKATQGRRSVLRAHCGPWATQGGAWMHIIMLKSDIAKLNCTSSPV